MITPEQIILKSEKGICSRKSVLGVHLEQFVLREQEIKVWDERDSWGKGYIVVVVELFSHVRLFASPRTAAYQAPPSMGFSRQECWSGLPFPAPGDLPDPGIEPRSPALQADSLLSEPPGKPPSQVQPKIKKWNL